MKSLSAFVGWMERAPTATMALHTVALESGLATADGPAKVAEVPSMSVQTAEPAAAPEATIELPPDSIGAAKKPVGGDVEVVLASKEIRAGSDGSGQGTVTLRVPEGFHVNSNEPPARWLTPTRVEIRPIKAEVSYPAATNDRFEGEVVIPFVVQLPSGEEGADFEITVTYQACTESECLLAQEKVFTAVLYK